MNKKRYTLKSRPLNPLYENSEKVQKAKQEEKNERITKNQNQT
jgi:hypothetical protein